MWHFIFCFRQATQAVIFRLMSMGLRSPKDSLRARAAADPESGTDMTMCAHNQGEVAVSIVGCWVYAGYQMPPAVENVVQLRPMNERAGIDRGTHAWTGSGVLIRHLIVFYGSPLSASITSVRTASVFMPGWMYRILMSPSSMRLVTRGTIHSGAPL